MNTEQKYRQLVSLLSHDLKTPLTAAIGCIDLVKEQLLGPLNQEQTSYLQSALASCRTTTDMIDNLLDIERLTEGGVTLQTVPTNLPELIKNVALRFTSMFDQAQIKLQLELEQNLPEPLLDLHKFERVIATLLAHAFSHARNGDTISARCYCSVPDRICISITAVGGASAALAASITASPSDGDLSRSSEMGLTFCRLATKAHNGTITVESQENSGTTITITLPLMAA